MRAFKFSENATGVISDVVNINFLYFFNITDHFQCWCLWEGAPQTLPVFIRVILKLLYCNYIEYLFGLTLI